MTGRSFSPEIIQMSSLNEKLTRRDDDVRPTKSSPMSILSFHVNEPIIYVSASANKNSNSLPANQIPEPTNEKRRENLNI